MGDSGRRSELTERATDHVLEHGLIGLSLRPLAAALGTSDRMLLYHFGTKDDLVAAVLVSSNDRSIAAVRALERARDVRAGVVRLWELNATPSLVGCQRVYVEAAALGSLGREPYAGLMLRANAEWLAAIGDYLVACGVPRRRSARVARLVEAAFSGLLLDLPLEGEQEGVPLERAVRDLADAAHALAVARR